MFLILGSLKVLDTLPNVFNKTCQGYQYQTKEDNFRKVSKTDLSFLTHSVLVSHMPVNSHDTIFKQYIRYRAINFIEFGPHLTLIIGLRKV